MIVLSPTDTERIYALTIEGRTDALRVLVYWRDGTAIAPSGNTPPMQAGPDDLPRLAAEVADSPSFGASGPALCRPDGMRILSGWVALSDREYVLLWGAWPVLTIGRRRVGWFIARRSPYPVPLYSDGSAYTARAEAVAHILTVQSWEVSPSLLAGDLT